MVYIIALRSGIGSDAYMICACCTQYHPSPLADDNLVCKVIGMMIGMQMQISCCSAATDVLLMALSA